MPLALAGLMSLLGFAVGLCVLKEPAAAAPVSNATQCASPRAQDPARCQLCSYASYVHMLAIFVCQLHSYASYIHIKICSSAEIEIALWLV